MQNWWRDGLGGALGACVALVVACGSTHENTPMMSGGTGAGGHGAGGDVPVSGGQAGNAAAGSEAKGGAGASAGDATGGAMVGVAGQAGSSSEGGQAGEGGAAPDPGPQVALSRLTLRTQFSDSDTAPTVTQPDTSESKGLWLVSSHLIFDTRTAQPAYEWYGEVKNFGDQSVCMPRVQVTFYAFADPPSLERYALEAEVHAPLLLTSQDQQSIRCLAPGESAAASSYSQGPDTKVFDSSVAVVSWLSLPATEVEVDPHAPTLEQLEIRGNVVDGFRVHGFANVGPVALYSITFDAFPKVGGLIVGQTSSLNFELPAQSQREIFTSPFLEPFALFLWSLDYSEPL